LGSESIDVGHNDFDPGLDHYIKSFFTHRTVDGQKGDARGGELLGLLLGASVKPSLTPDQARSFIREP
jgi:hypothetical protein